MADVGEAVCQKVALPFTDTQPRRDNFDTSSIAGLTMRLTPLIASCLIVASCSQTPAQSDLYGRWTTVQAPDCSADGQIIEVTPVNLTMFAVDSAVSEIGKVTSLRAHGPDILDLKIKIASRDEDGGTIHRGGRTLRFQRLSPDRMKLVSGARDNQAPGKLRSARFVSSLDLTRCPENSLAATWKHGPPRPLLPESGAVMERALAAHYACANPVSKLAQTFRDGNGKADRTTAAALALAASEGCAASSRTFAALATPKQIKPTDAPLFERERRACQIAYDENARAFENLRTPIEQGANFDGLAPQLRKAAGARDECLRRFTATIMRL